MGLGTVESSVKSSQNNPLISKSLIGGASNSPDSHGPNYVSSNGYNDGNGHSNQ